MRAETGTMRFEGDWRGVFIRGDNAFGYAIALKQHLEQYPASRHCGLEGLMNLLFSSDERQEGVKTQQMKPFQECAKSP